MMYPSSHAPHRPLASRMSSRIPNRSTCPGMRLTILTPFQVAKCYGTSASQAADSVCAHTHTYARPRTRRRRAFVGLGGGGKQSGRSWPASGDPVAIPFFFFNPLVKGRSRAGGGGGGGDFSHRIASIHPWSRYILGVMLGWGARGNEWQSERSHAIH